MSVLSKQSIQQAINEGALAITPFDVSHLKEASYTFTLDSNIQIPDENAIVKPGMMKYRGEIIPEEGYILQPGEMILGYTHESITLNGKYVCFLSVRRSCASVGLNVLLSDTFVEPDTDGKLTLEIVNIGPSPIVLMTGLPIVKGIFTYIE